MFSRFSKSLHSPKQRVQVDLSLYLIANRPSFTDESLFFFKIMESVKGGVSCVQLRDHQSDFASIVKTAIRLKKMLNGIPLFINTVHPIEVAQAVAADGIYLEEAVSYSEARKILGQKAFIGIPVKTMDDVLSAEQFTDVDYISVKIAPSKLTCPRNDELWGGVEALQTIRAISRHRIVVVGGRTADNVEPVYRILHITDGVAMAGGLMREEDSRKAAEKIQAARRRVQL